MAEVKREDVLAYLGNANMLEISELIKEIEDKFGVTAAAPVAIAGGAAPAAGDAAGAAEEKSEFDVELTGVGDKKINVIKEVRAFTGLGLREAKEAVEAAPGVIKEAVPQDEADKIKEALEAVGASVEIK